MSCGRNVTEGYVKKIHWQYCCAGHYTEILVKYLISSSVLHNNGMRSIYFFFFPWCMVYIKLEYKQIKLWMVVFQKSPCIWWSTPYFTLKCS